MNEESARADVRISDQENKAQPWLRNFTDFQGQVYRIPQGGTGTIDLRIRNEGNFPAWTCYVELYEGISSLTEPDYAALHLHGRTIITLQAGEERVVPLPWTRGSLSGQLFGVCYDPVLDPRNPVRVRVPHRHIVSYVFITH